MTGTFHVAVGLDRWEETCNRLAERPLVRCASLHQGVRLQREVPPPMELLSYRYSLDSLTASRSPSPVQRARESLTESSWLSPRLRVSTLSSLPFDAADREYRDAIPLPVSLASLRFLQRVEAVRLQHSIRKHGHRFYVMHVYLRSPRTPIYRRDPGHQVEHAYAAFFAFRDTIYECSLLTGDGCESCFRCLAVVAEMNGTVHDLKRMVRSSKTKEQRLEHFLHCAIQLCIDRQGSTHVCTGCQYTVEALARFLRPQYVPTTGII